MNKQAVIESVENWLDMVVIDLELCPFAERERIRQSIRFVATEAISVQDLVKDLHTELNILLNDDDVETTLLIHPLVLSEFYAFNDFLAITDILLEELNLTGIFQIASFHPKYEFEHSGPDDVENYTNRSPYPMLHLIREESLERAIASHPDIRSVPSRNCALMREMGLEKMKALLQSCFVNNK